MFAVNTRHAEHVLIFHQENPREVESGADGATFLSPIKTEPTVVNALIREMTHIIAMIFSIPTSALRDGNALTKSLENANKLMKEQAMAPKTDAKNTANHTHTQKLTNATSLTTNVKDAKTKRLHHQVAKKTERKLATTATLHQLSSSDATEPTKRTHHARDATKETKDVETKSRYAKTAHHQPNS